MQKAASPPRAFRAYFARHNRSVLALTLLTLVTALLLWAAACFVFYWLTLVILAASGGVDARMPNSFFLIFALSALALCLLGLIAEKIRPDHFPSDKKSPAVVFLDILLAIPRITLAVWGNLTACQFLGRRDLQTAWQLLGMIELQRRVPVQSLPLEFTDPRALSRVVLALQLVGLIEFRKNREGEAWLALHGEEAKRLVRSFGKIKNGR